MCGIAGSQLSKQSVGTIIITGGSRGIGAATALDSMTTGLAREVASVGIRVNSVRPGFIHTDMHADGGEEPLRVDRLSSGIPLRRGGEPEEVARAIIWLLSDEAAYAVGSAIDVTAGV